MWHMTVRRFSGDSYVIKTIYSEREAAVEVEMEDLCTDRGEEIKISKNISEMIPSGNK